MEKFCDRLHTVANIKKIFQADLARGTGKATSTVSKWWNGEIIPGPKNQREIADFFGCEVTWLTTGEGPMFKTDDSTPPPPPRKRLVATLDQGYDIKKEVPRKEVGEQPHTSIDPLFMCKVVLESPGVYSTALASNALAFYTAVKNEEEMNEMREESRETNKRIANLEKMMVEQSIRIQQLLEMQGGADQKREKKRGELLVFRRCLSDMATGK